MSDYSVWIALIRMWSCLKCKGMFAGNEGQCPYCLTPKQPDLFLL